MRSSLLLSCLVLACAAPLPRGLAAQAAQAPVTLDGALARFHAGSPALSLARNRLRAERASSRQGAALPNPTAAFSHEDLGVYSERYLTLSQRVDFLWDAPGRGRRADARALRATARFQADSAALVLELKEAYVATWEAGDRVSVLARADEVVASLLADARARLAEGDLAGYDVRRLEVERARVGRQLAEAVVEQELARAHLAALLGGEGITAAGVQELEGAPPPLTESFDAVATALARRPELDAVRAGVDEQRAEASLARSSLLAGTSVEAGVKRQSDGQNGLFLGVQLPLPVLDRKGSAIEGARAAVAGAESEAALVEAMVAVEATRARARLDAAARITELVGERGLAEAETLLAIARVAYGEGEIGIVEVVDAAQTFTEAALQGVRARVAAWSAYFELEKAVGGLRDVMHQGDGR